MEPSLEAWIKLMVGGWQKPARKFKVFTEKPSCFYFYDHFFFLTNKKSKKKLQHFLKFHDISFTICMNRKMCILRHCLEILFCFQLNKKSKWNENLFRVNT